MAAAPSAVTTAGAESAAAEKDGGTDADDAVLHRAAGPTTTRDPEIDGRIAAGELPPRYNGKPAPERFCREEGDRIEVPAALREVKGARGIRSPAPRAKRPVPLVRADPTGPRGPDRCATP